MQSWKWNYLGRTTRKAKKQPKTAALRKAQAEHKEFLQNLGLRTRPRRKLDAAVSTIDTWPPSPKA